MTTALAGMELAARINEVLPGAIVEEAEEWLRVQPERIVDVCRHLKETQGLEFDFPEAVSAVDYIDHFEIVYHLLSLRRNHTAVLKVSVYGREEPTVPSVTSVWAGANLQEREIYDLMGVHFEGHPNMKRVMLWDTFPGHPLRKDFRDSGGGAI